MKTALRWLPFALLAFTCGGSKDPGTMTADFCQRYADASCDFAIRCEQVASSAKLDCVTYYQGLLCQPAFASVTKGYQTFDQTAGSACVEKIRNAACNDTTAFLSCETFVTPAVGPNGACLQNGDCKNKQEACGGANACARTCQPSGKLGQPCSAAGQCTDSRCDTNNMCVAPAPVGTVGSCQKKAVGDACRKYGNECPAESFCNLAVDGGSGTCVASSTGSPCTNGYECRATDVCKGSLCAKRPKKGESCSNLDCEDGLACVTSGSGKVCGKGGELGATCAAPYGDCIFPFGCVEGKCVHTGSSGEKCISGLLCISGGCDVDAGICGPKQGAGAPCGFFAANCASGTCAGGACTAACQ